MLYQKITCKMAEYLEREAVIEKEQKEECAYGLEMLISSICLAGMLFGVAYFLKAIDKAILYYILFAWIRKYAGGYHAKTYIGCTSLYLLTFCFSVFMERNLLYILNLEQVQSFEIVVMISLMITVVSFAPIENANNPIEKENKEKYYYYALVRTVIVIIINIVCMVEKNEVYHWNSICLFWVLIYMYIGKWIKR